MSKKEVLEREGVLLSSTFGTSMRPFLKEKDVAVIEKKEGRLSLYDIALYQSGEKLLLHRVVGVLEEGYLMRGDNTFSDETVKEEAVLGVMSERVRGGKSISSSDRRWKRHGKRNAESYPVRRFFFSLKQRLKRILAFFAWSI